MLHSLHIRNYVLIDSLDITFPEGLVIITGQTGAGKSILLGALSLLAGSKADAASITEGQDSLVVEAEFKIDSAEEQIRAILEEAEIDWEPGGLIIRRTVAASGRSRCFVNDTPTQVGVLAELSRHLIDIHSQHQSLMLSDKRFQTRILDLYCGAAQETAQAAVLWKELQTLTKRKSEYETRLTALSNESDYNRSQFEQLKAAGLKEGELEALVEEQKQLAGAEMIMENLAGAQGLLSETGGRESIGANLKEASRMLSKISSYVSEAGGLAERLESARIEIDDITSSLDDLSQGLNLSPERLQAVEDRLSTLYSLMKKHGCRDITELIAVRDSFAGALGDSTDLEDLIIEVTKQITRVRTEWKAIADSIHARRISKGPEFAASIRDSLRFLELDRAEFLADITEAQEGPDGYDSIQFRFSSNGTPPADVAKCASGGEISRIMLCLKAMMARFVGMPTLIFDEIDTGVSGSVADKMGRMICEMGSDMQVFSITHLPQVAAKGHAHYIVSKDLSGSRAVSSLRKVEGEERVLEIARLLSGSTITPQAVENAKSLISGE